MINDGLFSIIVKEKRRTKGLSGYLHFPTRSTVVPLADAAMEPQELWPFPSSMGRQISVTDPPE